MAPQSDASLTALLVDDDPDILRLAELSLSELAKWKVFTAMTSEEALEVAARETLDVVVLDLMMPGTGGAWVLERLKERSETASIPVVMMTARGEDEVTRSCTELGAVGLIVKPFDPITLADTIRRLLPPK